VVPLEGDAARDKLVLRQENSNDDIVCSRKQAAAVRPHYHVTHELKRAVISMTTSPCFRAIGFALALLTSAASLPGREYRGKGFVVSPSNTASIASNPARVQFYDTSTGIITDIIELKAPSAENLLRGFVANHPIVLEYQAEFDKSSTFCAYGNWVGRSIHGRATINGHFPVTIQAIGIEANNTTYLLLMVGPDSDFDRMQRFINLANSLRFDRVPGLASGSSSTGGSSAGCPGCAAAMIRSMGTLTKQTTGMMK
jgi:hypothetical protein